MNNMDIAFLKQSLNDLKFEIKNNTVALNKQTEAINMANLLKMVELGLIPRDNIKNQCLEYTKKYIKK